MPSILLHLDPSGSPSLPSPATSQPPPSRRRSQVNPDAPKYIFAIGGGFFTLGLVLSAYNFRRLQRQARQVAVQAREAKKAALLEDAKLAGGPLPGRRRIPSILSPKLPPSTQPKPVASSSWNSSIVAALLPNTVPSIDSLPKPAPSLPSTDPSTPSLPSLPSSSPPSTLTATTPSPSPLFPVSRTRPSKRNLPPAAPPSNAWDDEDDLPSDLADADAADLPPLTTAVVMKAFAAFGIATAMAVTGVVGPFIGVCWWLDVKEPADFTPAFRAKVAELFPSMAERMLAPDLEDDTALTSITLPAWLKQSTPEDETEEELKGNDQLNEWARWLTDGLEKDRLERVEEKRLRESAVTREDGSGSILKP